MLMYGSGLRLLEALGLRVKDLDFDLGEIRIRRASNFHRPLLLRLGQPCCAVLPNPQMQLTGRRGAKLRAGGRSGGPAEET